MNYLYEIFRKEQLNRKDDDITIKYFPKTNTISYIDFDNQINVSFKTSENEKPNALELFSYTEKNHTVNLAEISERGKYVSFNVQALEKMNGKMRRVFRDVFNDYVYDREKVGLDKLPIEFYQDGKKSKEKSPER